MADKTEYRKLQVQVKSKIRRLSEERQKNERLIAEIESENGKIDREISELEKIEAGFSALQNGSDDDRRSHVAVPARITREMGITDAVTSVVQHASGAVFPTQVRDQLIQSGFENTSSLLPMIHNILGRLVERRLIERTKVAGKTCYKTH